MKFQTLNENLFRKMIKFTVEDTGIGIKEED